MEQQTKTNAHIRAARGDYLSPQDIETLELHAISEYKRKQREASKAGKKRREPSLKTITKWHQAYIKNGVDKHMSFDKYKGIRIRQWRDGK